MDKKCILVCRPILFLLVLPSLLTFGYFKAKLDAEPLTLRVDAGSRPWQAAVGIYVLVNNNKKIDNGILFSKPLDPFYMMEGSPDFFVKESSTGPSCLYHASKTVAPVCSNRSIVQGDYLDSEGNLLVSISRNPRRQSSNYISNKNWRLLTQQIPATSLLMALNVILAYIYWERRVDPSAVAKVYDSMVHPPFEIWRSFTGSTAHFSLWHLGLNMMSFAALGQEVEPRFSSLVFLYYNISLMPIVTAIWLSLHWLGTRFFQSANQQRAPTVGYSGVLFAWMVIAALEQPQTCPVIFLPDLCFGVFKLGVFRFSLAPIVQLFVMQIILPRVSFYGHLAGIIAGFFVHWGMLPIRWVQPWVLLPVLYLGYLQLVRGIKFKPVLFTFSSLRSSGRLCLSCQLAIITISACSLQWDEVGAHGTTAIFWMMTQVPGNELTERHLFAKATTVAALLGITSNCAKIGFLIALHSLHGIQFLLLVARVFALLWLMRTCGISDLGDEEGIFEQTLSFIILTFCRSLGPVLPTSDDGHRLGGSPTPGNGERQLSRLV